VTIHNSKLDSSREPGAHIQRLAISYSIGELSRFFSLRLFIGPTRMRPISYHGSCVPGRHVESRTSSISGSTWTLFSWALSKERSRLAGDPATGQRTNQRERPLRRFELPH
jgi:hypothetical protein